MLKILFVLAALEGSSSWMRSTQASNETSSSYERMFWFYESSKKYYFSILNT